MGSALGLVRTVLTLTLVILQAKFMRLVPLAAARRVRLIRVNMRDYPGSSMFSEKELEAFRGDQEAQGAAVAKLGREIVALLEHIIKQLSLSPVSIEGGKRTGGVAVMAWSYGNVVTMSMLAHAGQLPSQTQDVLNRYVRTVVLYGEPTEQSHLPRLLTGSTEPSVTTLGVPRLEGAYHPLRWWVGGKAQQSLIKMLGESEGRVASPLITHRR